ncbi:5-formyltetrahydrofolate cyclo-ligase [Rheinheimera sp. WS51]|uniref:5-formyltetrahydrofolate cyclo-ligase n=1 Tax=Rheinheimera sp. WS51 TaxID=3425886 RepID=UPI003D8D3D10
MQTRAEIRKHIRLSRQQLSLQQQQVAAEKLVEQVLLLPQFNTSQHIALYLTNDGELDTSLLIQALWQLNKQVYLPVMHPFAPGYLLFVAYNKNTLLQANKFGILEPYPECQHIIPLAKLDIVFTPLVAFDNKGNRLGMGGGFYDRTLSQLPNKHATELVGLAHSCQQVAALPTESWDIPLNTIITPDKIWQFS